MAAPQPQPKRDIIAEIRDAYREPPAEDVDADDDNPIPTSPPDPPATI